MGSYTVEQVEFLRQRADITYEEALEVLERCNGDLTRCLVDLERRGKIRKNGPNRSYATYAQPSYARRESQRENSSFSLSGLIKKLLRMHLVVTKETSKDGKKNIDVYINLPVLFLIVVALCAPHLALISVVLMFVFGLKIRVENNEGEKVGNEKFYDTVDKVADNIKTTVTHFARAAQENVGKTRRQDVENHTPYQAQETPAEEPVVYAKPASEAEEEAVDIPEVTPYEAFTGTESVDEEPEKKNEPGEENEIIIG